MWRTRWHTLSLEVESENKGAIAGESEGGEQLMNTNFPHLMRVLFSASLGHLDFLLQVGQQGPLFCEILSSCPFLCQFVRSTNETICRTIWAKDDVVHRSPSPQYAVWRYFLVRFSAGTT